MGEVVAFNRKAEAQDDVTVLHDASGRPAVTLTLDGRIVTVGNMDAASEAFWRAVEGQVRTAWEESGIPRLKAQVSLLRSLLDAEVPGWRAKLRGR